MLQWTMDEPLRKPYQGQLVKFTNVVKGWQTRWFVLNPELGTLHYYLSESDLPSRARGSIQLAGAVISPSDEDCHTFTVSPASGEAYKLRAQDTRDRQMWLNRLRMIAEMHTRAIAHHHPPLAPREHRIPPSTGTPSLTGGNAAMPTHSSSGHAPSSHQSPAATSATPLGASMGGGIGGLAVLDAFTQVSELLQEAHRQNANLAFAVEDLPSHGLGLKCNEPNLLLLKATSQATVLCLDSCLNVLKLQQHCNVYQQRPRQGSPSLRSSSPSFRNRTAPHSPVPPAHTPLQPLQQQSEHASLITQHKSTALGNNQQHNSLNNSQQLHTPLTQTVSLNSPTSTNASNATTKGHGDGKAKSVACLNACPGNTTTATSSSSGDNAGIINQSAAVTTTAGSRKGSPLKFATIGDIKGIDVMTGELNEGKNCLQAQLTPSHSCQGPHCAAVLPTVPTGATIFSNRLTGPRNSDSEESDDDSSSTSHGDGSDNTESNQQQHSVIVHIISQLRLGMDLTRVTLPTFILEKRSLLEMFADFLGHPDYFLKIADCSTSEERLLAVVRWYMSSVHVGRRGSQAKKPYNPIIGETFQCGWRVPRVLVDKLPPEGKAAPPTSHSEDYVSVRFAAEQVSHHPPVSAFYFECPEKQLCLTAHIWTKSKFMGMSVGVNLIGDITLTVGGVEEAPCGDSASTNGLQDPPTNGGDIRRSSADTDMSDKLDSLNIMDSNKDRPTSNMESKTNTENVPTATTINGTSIASSQEAGEVTSGQPNHHDGLSSEASSHTTAQPSQLRGNGGHTGTRRETYTLSMPSAYARNILTEPWAELGGRVNIACTETGCSAPIVFHTKPFYGGCLHRISGEVKSRRGAVVCRLSGEWDGRMEMVHSEGHTEVLDVRSLPVVCNKRVRPIRAQGEGESRRLWQDVTSALCRQDIDTATAHKRRLEDLQRSYEGARKARGEDYTGKLFTRVRVPSEDGTEAAPVHGGAQHWVYRQLPSYAVVGCVSGGL